MTATAISWTDEVWNPVTGCTKVSAGCKNCYAEAVANRYWPHLYGERKFTDVRVHPERLEQPFHWRKPRRVFVNSMSDLFHDAVPDWFLDAVFATMGCAQRHTFQVLTKRPQRMRDYLSSNDTSGRILAVMGAACSGIPGASTHLQWQDDGFCGITIPNVWLGVSVEDQRAADERIPILLDTPAALRWLSCEPLIESISIWRRTSSGALLNLGPVVDGRGIDWVVAGGESGPGHRTMDIAWARDLREQCRVAGVPFFFKQTSGPRPGMGTDALGEVVQEFPEVVA